MRFLKIRFVVALAVIGLATWALQAQSPVFSPVLLIHAPANGVGFGGIATGVTSPQKTITLQNVGNGPLTVDATTAPVPPLTGNDFAVGFSNCGTVAAGGYCTISVTFTPTANGPRTARLLLQTNAATTAFVIPLLGTGVDPAFAQPSVGPIDARTGFPFYFSDGQYAVELCLDYTPPLDAAGNPLPQAIDPLTGLLAPTMCLAPAPDPTRAPAVTDDPATTNFGAEAFWWSAEAIATPLAGNPETRLLLVQAQEAAFVTENAKAGDQWAFGRIRFRVDDAVANARYRFTYPFGVEIHQASDTRVFATSDIGCFNTPCDFTLALPGSSLITNFLACLAPAPPAGYLGDPNQVCTITGSPLGTNFFRVERETSPNSNTWTLVGETNLFAVSGKLTAPVAPPPPTNQGPDAVDDVASTPYNTPVIIAVLNNDTDPNVGDVLSISSVTGAANGTPTINGTTITYTPNAAFTAGGIDTFQYAISDPGGLTDTATVRVTVGAVPPANRAPTATNDTFLLLPDLIFPDPQMLVSVPGVLDNDIDLDGNVLSVELVSGPADNPLAPGFPTLALNPDGSFLYNHGVGIASDVSPTPVTFTYRVFDGEFFSNVATVTINVTRPVGQPVANDDAISTPMDTAITHNVDGNDTNGNVNATPGLGLRQPSIAIRRQPANGVAVVVRPDPLVADRQVTYTPNAGFVGVDTFTYTVEDTQLFTSNVATVTVTVTGPAANNDPVAVDDSASTAFETPVIVAVLANDSDADGDPLSVTGVSAPVGGTAAVNADSSVTFTPALGFSGAGSFAYTISDGLGGSASANVSVTVGPRPNTNPVAANDSASTAFQTPVIVAVLANDSDADGDPLSVTGVSAPVGGTAAVNANGTVTFTPAAGFSGAGSFAYAISDGRGGSASASVAVTVGPRPNTNPVAVNDSANTAFQTAVIVSVLANDSDADGDPLSVTGVSALVGGTAAVNANGTVTFTPAAGFSGAGSFAYAISDGRGGSASANVAVTVAAEPGGDPTQVLMVFSQGTGARTATVTTTTPGVRLVAFVGSDGPSGANNQAVTVSGGGLTWTRVRQQRQRSGVAEIWTAVAPTPLTSVGITSTQSTIGNFPQQITVVGFTNVSAVGASNGASTPGATAVAASASLVTQGAGSVVYGVGIDWATIAARTVGAGQTKLREYSPATFITSWVQRLNGVTGAAGSTVALTTTAPTSTQWNMAVIELMR